MWTLLFLYINVAQANDLNNVGPFACESTNITALREIWCDVAKGKYEQALVRPLPLLNVLQPYFKLQQAKAAVKLEKWDLALPHS